MKSVIVREITSLVLRPTRPNAATAPVTTSSQTGASHIKFTEKGKEEKKDTQQNHSKYYATITFNQIMLSPTPGDREVAVQLINVYFELFKEILGEGGFNEEPPAEVADDENAVLGQKGKKTFRGSKRPKGKKGKENRGEAGFVEVEDSESKITSAILTGVNRALPYAKLDVGDVS